MLAQLVTNFHEFKNLEVLFSWSRIYQKTWTYIIIIIIMQEPPLDLF
jgi:hypothetical protein